MNNILTCGGTHHKAGASPVSKLTFRPATTASARSFSRFSVPADGYASFTLAATQTRQAGMY